jgi:2-oxoisovalerate dehydrogenase E1 component alpha subunit
MEIQEIDESAPTGVPHAEGVIRVLRLDGTADPERRPDLPDGVARAILEKMILARALDERLAALSSEGAIGYYPPSRGEEAAVVAAAAAFDDRDWLVAAPRTLGAFLWRGVTVESLVHHAFGNLDDASKGRRMPAHPSARSARITSAGALEGRHIAHATGLGWAARLAGEPVVAGTWLDAGDVASNDFHTGLNFAGVFEAPVVFVCRNGSWDDEDDLRRGPTETVAEKGVAYGVDALRADGTDPLAVWAAVREARQQAAAGRGPTLVELLTRRATSQPAPIDPLARLSRWAASAGVVSADERGAMDAAAEEAVGRAVEVGRARGSHDPASVFEDVYAELPNHLVDQRGRR